MESAGILKPNQKCQTLSQNREANSDRFLGLPLFHLGFVQFHTQARPLEGAKRSIVKPEGSPTNIIHEQTGTDQVRCDGDILSCDGKMDEGRGFPGPVQ